MTAPAMAPISIEERLATVEATLAAFIAEERVWRNQFVEDQREYRRDTIARFDAQAATLAEYRQETTAALVEHRQETTAALAEHRQEATAALAEHRQETIAALAEHRQAINARFDAQAAALSEYRRETAESFAEYRRETNARFDEVIAELREQRRQMDARMDRMYLAIMGFMGAVIVAGVGGVIAILASNG